MRVPGTTSSTTFTTVRRAILTGERGSRGSHCYQLHFTLNSAATFARVALQGAWNDSARVFSCAPPLPIIRCDLHRYLDHRMRHDSGGGLGVSVPGVAIGDAIRARAGRLMSFSYTANYRLGLVQATSYKPKPVVFRKPTQQLLLGSTAHRLQTP
jgi:hypothetical protein